MNQLTVSVREGNFPGVSGWAQGYQEGPYKRTVETEEDFG